MVSKISCLTALVAAVLLALPATAQVRFDDLDGRFLQDLRESHGHIPGTGLEDPRAWELLRDLKGPEGRPFDCATPLTLEAVRTVRSLPLARRHEATARLAAPQIAGARVWKSPDSRLLVRYTTVSNSPDAIPTLDANSNGVPDALERLDRAVVHAREILVDHLGWEDPSDDQPFEIVLASLPGPSAYLIPSGEVSGDAGIRTTMVLDPRVLQRESKVTSMVAHQLAHASQWHLSLEEEPWWYEASAAWAGLRAGGDYASILPRLHQRARNRETSLRAQTIGGALGATQFLLYLEERGGPEMVTGTWRLLAEGQDTLLEVLDRELLSLDGHGLRDHVRYYNLWNLATGSNDTGDHYRNGSLLPIPEIEPVIRRFPDAGAERTRAPEGLGVNYLGFITSNIDEGVSVRFEGDSEIDWAVDLVGVLPRRRGFERIPMTLNSGLGSLTVPGSRYDQIILAVHNLEEEAGRSGTYSWSVELAPDYPFEMAEMRAIPSRGHVLLHWTSLGEQDLYGWRVLAAASPAGPWEPIQPFLLPAIGVDGGAQDYSLVDSDVVGGERRFYRIEGVTVHGVPVSSPIMSTVPIPVLTRSGLR